MRTFVSWSKTRCSYKKNPTQQQLLPSGTQKICDYQSSGQGHKKICDNLKVGIHFSPFFHETMKEDLGKMMGEGMRHRYQDERQIPCHLSLGCHIFLLLFFVGFTGPNLHSVCIDYRVMVQIGRQTLLERLSYMYFKLLYCRTRAKQNTYICSCRK